MAAVTGVGLLRSKFRGCLLGALFGDALGAEFEGMYINVPVPSYEFEQFSDEKMSEMKESKKHFHYTDDSAMTMALCRSLLSEKTFNINHLAQQFAETYFQEPFRGYGGAVITVFDRLKTETLEDVTLPAREQFDGSGSYGNGAAMRVSPLALFYHNDFEGLKSTSEQNALITHAHALGVQGAILQAVAVYESLHVAPGTLDVAKYIDKMIVVAQELEGIEKDENLPKRSSSETSPDKEETSKIDDEGHARQSYVTQFKHIKQMLVESADTPSIQDVIDTLGHGIRAVEAVPAAIFAFLCKSDTYFKDVLFYAMSLGGDTDTIASMAGALAGAYWGDRDMPDKWFSVTESVTEMTEYAEKVYDMRVQEG